MILLAGTLKPTCGFTRALTALQKAGVHEQIVVAGEFKSPERFGIFKKDFLSDLKLFRKKLNIKFLRKKVTSGLFTRLLENAGLFIMPYEAGEELWLIKAALASGVKVIASDLPGHARIANKKGRVTIVHSDKELKKAFFTYS